MDENKNTMPNFHNWDEVIKFAGDAINSNNSLAAQAIDSHEKLSTELMKDAERKIKHWIIAFLVTLAALFATNIYWIYTFQSYEYVSQDGDGINNVNTGEQGDLINGTENEAKEERTEQGN